jgi:hypothetical protein
MRNKIVLAAIAAWLLGVAWAQSPSTTGAQAKVKPATHSPAGPHGVRPRSNLHSVNLILRQQMKQIKKDRKSGKLTEDQAKAKWENLKSIRRQELEYFKQNGRKEITDDQKSQLSSALSQTAGSN